jgi:hypothetical protein
MSTKFLAFDAAEYLDSEEAIATYLNEVVAEEGPDLSSQPWRMLRVRADPALGSSPGRPMRRSISSAVSTMERSRSTAQSAIIRAQKRASFEVRGEGCIVHGDRVGTELSESDNGVFVDAGNGARILSEHPTG